jgi:hypothetical protein
MKSHLPAHLNPERFSSELDVYSDDYENRYSLEYDGRGLLIENKLPLMVFLAVGIHGEEPEDRRQIIEMLQIAESIHCDFGQWPRLETEWQEMCPGGLIKLDVTSLTDVHSARAPLPQVLKAMSARVRRILESGDSSFVGAERHYREELKGIAAFNEPIRVMQREFDAKPVCALNANTKARRLRYLIVLAYLADAPTNTKVLSNNLLKWAREHSSELSRHEDSRGAILSSTGPRSVRPYLDLLRQLSILMSVGRGITLSNTGRILVLFQSACTDFTLSHRERLYFLFELFLHDRDVVCPLILQLSASSSQRKRDIRKVFPEVYKQHLTSLRDHCGTATSRRRLDVALQRVTEWRSAEKYMEHVVDPRISWLVDLEFCRLKGDHVSLTERGLAFAQWLTAFKQDNILILTQEVLRQRFFGSIVPIIEPAQEPVDREKPAEDKVIELLRGYCRFVSDHTVSLAPNRIVASTLFRYIGISLWVEHRIAADFTGLLGFFSNENRASRIGWRLRWLPAQDDGYLTPVTD